MTLNPFLRMLATALFFMAFWLAATVAATAAPKWKAEVGIAGWCYSLESVTQFAEIIQKGDLKAAQDRLNKATESRACVILPRPVVSFRPSGIVSEFKWRDGEEMVAMKGNLIQPDGSLGREVYLWLPKRALPQFQLDTPAKIPPFAPSGPKFDGWQDL